MEKYRVVKEEAQVADVYNDGLSLEDFKAWFNPVFDEYEAQHGQGVKASSLTFAVIQFTTFRY